MSHTRSTIREATYVKKEETMLKISLHHLCILSSLTCSQDCTVGQSLKWRLALLLSLFKISFISPLFPITKCEVSCKFLIELFIYITTFTDRDEPLKSEYQCIKTLSSSRRGNSSYSYGPYKVHSNTIITIWLYYTIPVAGYIYWQSWGAFREICPTPLKNSILLYTSKILNASTARNWQTL